jgi:hypothetical protein
MEDYKVVIAGGRDFDNYELLSKTCDFMLSEKIKTHNVVIISGAARGADTLGERYAQEHGLGLDRHPANWDLHGKAAGYIRNKEMVDIADACICFWDGKSKGTKHTIDLSIEKGIKLKIVHYDK